MSLNKQKALAITAAIALLILSSCARSNHDTSKISGLDLAETTIPKIVDNTGSESYSVGESVVLRTSSLGTELRSDFNVTNPNRTKFSPHFEVLFEDGSVLICEVDDIRRTPSLVPTTTSWDFKCTGLLPEGAEPVQVVVTDIYN